jgi:hypothetical protein
MARIAAIAIAALFSHTAFAQPAEPPPEIEMEPAPATPPAPTPTKDPKEAKKWLAAAQTLVQKGLYYQSHNKPDDAKQQFTNAVTAYQKAIEAGDDVNVYFELAAVDEKLEKVDEAVKHLRVVTQAQTGVRPDVAKKAAAKLDELSAKVGVVTLVVTPDNTSITLGGAELGKSPLTAPLVLMPGTYTLAFAADGFQPKEAEIVVEAGSESERKIDLEPVKVIVEPARPVGPDEAPPPTTGPDKLPLYIGVGAAGAGVLGVTIFGIAAVVEHGTFVGKSTNKADRSDAQSNGKTFAVLADVSLGITVAAAGFTAYWYYKYKKAADKTEDHPATVGRAKIDVIPWVQSQGGGLGLAGSF